MRACVCACGVSVSACCLLMAVRLAVQMLFSLDPASLWSLHPPGPRPGSWRGDVVSGTSGSNSGPCIQGCRILGEPKALLGSRCVGKGSPSGDLHEEGLGREVCECCD